MIAADQPTIFPKPVVVKLSSADDGSMKDGEDLLTAEAIDNRQKFLAQTAGNTDNTAVFYASFDGDDYCRYRQATPGLHGGVDGMATRDKNQSIMLPLADCTGAVLYDPDHQAIMVSHLGRHSTEQIGATRSVEYMTKVFGTDPSQLMVWLSPSPGVKSYPLHAFGGRGFREVLKEQLVSAGVAPSNIQISDIDTATDANYFSHSEFIKGNRTEDGRYALVACLV